MLDFPDFIREILAPFSIQTTNYRIENENLASAKYTFLYELNFYSIVITWDRIIIRSESNLDNLVEKNSIIEEPYLNIFNKIKSVRTFGYVKDYLSYSLAINTSDKNSRPDVINKFSKRFTNEQNIGALIGTPTDIALVVENKEGSIFKTVTTGPYLGIEDLKKRNINIESPKSLESAFKLGEIAEVKIHELNPNISFAKYKEVVASTNKILNTLWP